MSAGNMEKVLRLMADKSASDVYLSANTPILIKIHGQILQLSDQLLTTHQTRQLLAELLAPQQMEELEDTGELNVGISLPGSGERPVAPVYVDGVKTVTLKGDAIAEEFQRIVEDYVRATYGGAARTSALDPERRTIALKAQP